jgi:hypothetical protein
MNSSECLIITIIITTIIIIITTYTNNSNSMHSLPEMYETKAQLTYRTSVYNLSLRNYATQFDYTRYRLVLDLFMIQKLVHYMKFIKILAYNCNTHAFLNILRFRVCLRKRKSNL